MPILRFLVLLTISTLATPSHAAESAENVILVTMDGLRFQELFSGADKRLINKADGKVEDAKLTTRKYWDDSPVERRRKMMPFFWEVVAEQGQIFGSPEHQSKVTVENGRFFSYPGYNEILTGIADKTIDSNKKNPNKNVTVLEWLHRRPQFKDRVMAFCSWDVFPFIINEARSGIPVNAGWEPLDVNPNAPLTKAYNEMAKELPRYWQAVRYDSFTFRGAMESLKAQRPRLLYVALGETDDWCHDGRYDLYLDSALQNDNFIRRLWEQAQSMEQYRGKTALLITTDHGRGDGREGWKSHNNELPGSERIWIAAMGPGIPNLGLRKDIDATQGQIAPTVAKLLGADFTRHDPRIPKPLSFTE